MDKKRAIKREIRGLRIEMEELLKDKKGLEAHSQTLADMALEHYHGDSYENNPDYDEITKGVWHVGSLSVRNAVERGEVGCKIVSLERQL